MRRITDCMGFYLFFLVMAQYIASYQIKRNWKRIT